MSDQYTEQIKELFKHVSVPNKNLDDDFRLNSLIFEDKDRDLNAVISVQSLNQIFDMLTELREENLELKLERAIWKYVPIDFADTWAVVMHELEDKKHQNEPIDDANLNNIVKDVKKKHPNLFLNIDDLLPSEIRHIG